MGGVMEIVIDQNFDVCCVTETWFSAKENARFAYIHEMGFDVLNSPRKGRGGGIAVVFNTTKLLDSNHLKLLSVLLSV